MTIKYTGNGNYFSGIPARDLTDEEFAALPEPVQQTLLDSGVYVPETPTVAKASKSATVVVEPAAVVATSG